MLHNALVLVFEVVCCPRFFVSFVYSLGELFLCDVGMPSQIDLVKLLVLVGLVSEIG